MISHNSTQHKKYIGRNITNMASKRKKKVDEITLPGVGGNDVTVKQEEPTGQAKRVKKEDFGDDALTLKQCIA